MSIIDLLFAATFVFGLATLISYVLKKVPYWFTAAIFALNAAIGVVIHANDGRAWTAILGVFYFFSALILTAVLFSKRKINKNS